MGLYIESKLRLFKSFSLKPENIMLSDVDCEVKLCDFGTATFFRENSCSESNTFLFKL